MTEEQLRVFPSFRDLPIYDETDPRAGTIVRNHSKECCTLEEVEKYICDKSLKPLGALRAGPVGQSVVVAYFGEAH